MVREFTQEMVETLHVKDIALIVGAFIVVVVFLAWRKDYL